MNSVKNFLNKNIAKSSNKIMSMNSILYNRFVLYIFVFMALINLMFFASTNDIRSLLTLLIVGFLTSFFSKNMIVILCVALSVGHVTKYGTGNGTRREGATTMADSTDKEGDTETEEKPESKPSSDKKKKAKEELMKGLKEFQSVQGDLMSGIEKLQPMLTKAESFIEKYENYKNIN